MNTNLKQVLGASSFSRWLGGLSAFLAGVATMLAALNASSQGTSSATIAWDANPDPAVAGYHVYYGLASGIYTSMLDAGRAATATLPGLVGGAIYYVAVTDYDTNGSESGFSPEITCTVSNTTQTNTQIVVLPPPVVLLTSPADGSTWDAPATINFSSSLIANGHSISSVQYYQGTNVIGMVSSPPYGLVLNNIGAGGYQVFARVFYDTNTTLDSSLATISVVTPPPTIVAQPGNVSGLVGMTATLAVSASGPGSLSYQWQLNGVNLSANGPFSGITTAALSIPNAQLTNSGIYSVVITGPGGTVTSSNAVVAVHLPDTNFVTSTVSFGRVRNDFTGFVGMKLTVGTSPLILTELGRYMLAGNAGTHLVKLLNAADGTDVPGASALVNMNGGTVGRFQYGYLNNPITLPAGGSYCIVSQETIGGDTWYNGDSTVTTTSVAKDTGGLWGYGVGSWYLSGTSNQTYCPLDFRHAVNTNRTPYVSTVAAGTLHNNFTGFLGIKIVVGNAPLTVTDLGRFVLPANSATHVIKLVNATNGTDVPGTEVSVNLNGGTVGQFQYASLTNAVTLPAGGSYFVLSQEITGGDSWYNGDANLTTTSVAAETAGIWGYGPGQWYPYGTPNQAFVPVNFKYLSP